MDENEKLTNKLRKSYQSIVGDNVIVDVKDSPVTDINVKGLSLFFTVFCIVDLFGVFPVIALPKAVIVCGMYGVPIVLVVFALQIYTAILLGRCWLIAEELDPSIVHKNRYPYAALAEMTFGPSMSNFVTILLDATIFGGGVPNLLVASQNLQLFGLKMSDYNLNFSFCLWLIIIGFLLLPIMCLGSPKDMKVLSILSVLVVTSVTAITCFCIVEDTESTRTFTAAPTAVPSLQDFLTAYGILAFQFDIHPMLLTIQVDMKNKRNINYAIIGGFLATGVMFTITTILAANKYGVNIEENLLQGLPASFPLYVVVLLVTLQLCLSSAVGSSALFQHIEDKLGVSRDFNSKRCLIRACVVFLAVFLGESVPRFDLVMGLIGSTLTGPLMFIFPPLFYNKMLYIKNNTLKSTQTSSQASSAEEFTTETSFQKILKNTIPTDLNNYFAYNKKEKIKNSMVKLKCLSFVMQSDFLLAFFIMCFGLMATLIATFYSWSDAIRYAQFTPPCLVNMTAASSYLQA